MKNYVLGLLVLLTITISTHVTGQSSMVVLVNEIPTVISMNGEQIISAESMSIDYLAGYERTPKGYDIFQKSSLLSNSIETHPIIAVADNKKQKRNTKALARLDTHVMGKALED